MSKIRFPLAQGQAVAEQVVLELSPFCERIQIAGSIRRKCPSVGDIELLIEPRTREASLTGDLFPHLINETFQKIDHLEIGRASCRERV